MIASVKDVLDFEYTHRLIGSKRSTKIQAIRQRWGANETQYIAHLYRAIDTAEAIVLRPDFVRSLRRERAERREIRTGATVRQLGAGPDPRQTTIADIPPRREAQAAKERGMARADAAASSDWKAAWIGAIERLARAGRQFTSDDVRALAGAPTDHPNAAGSRFTQAARRGLIVKVGYRPSDRASLHRHPLAVWVGADAKEGVA